MKVITLNLKYDGSIPVEAETITPDIFSDKSKEEIEELSLYLGNKVVKLREIFDVSVEGSSTGIDDVKIIIKGNAYRIKRIGEGMTGGEILVEGNVDMRCGSTMRGGKITIKGNADSWTGQEMVGGEIIIEGDAGNYIGSGYRGALNGMSGGKITIKGNAGLYLGEKMNGGEIVVEKDADMLAGLEMSGGKITIKGNAIMPGGEMTGGDIIVMGTVIDRLPTFKYLGKEIIDNADFEKYVGDLAMRRAKGSLYIKAP